MFNLPSEVLTSYILPACSIECIINLTSTCHAGQELEKNKLLFTCFKELIYGDKENTKNGDPKIHVFRKIVEAFSDSHKKITFKNKHNNKNEQIAECLIYFMTKEDKIKTMVISPFYSDSESQCKNPLEINQKGKLILTKLSKGFSLHEKEMRDLGAGKLIRQIAPYNHNLKEFNFAIPVDKLVAWILGKKDVL